MLVPVDPRFLAETWEWVREGLVKIIAKTSDDWLPEDVYTEIRTGNSVLFLIYDGHERVGFVVLQGWPAYQAGPRLFIRALWGEPHRLVRIRDQLMKALKDEARKIGARVLRMNSPRRWDADGWTMKQYVYEMDV